MGQAAPLSTFKINALQGGVNCKVKIFPGSSPCPCTTVQQHDKKRGLEMGLRHKPLPKAEGR